MAAGGVTQQRAEMRAAIGPGTANYARLKSADLKNNTKYADDVKAICDKNVNDWTHDETVVVACMFIVGVHC